MPEKAKCVLTLCVKNENPSANVETIEYLKWTEERKCEVIVTKSLQKKYLKKG